MPSSGTHITILERVALLGDFEDIIGSLSAAEGSEQARRMKFAKLGAIGPDLFYALMDYGPELQNLASFLSKMYGSFECIAKLGSDIDAKISEVEADVTLGASEYFKQATEQFEEVVTLLGAIVKDGLMSMLVSQGMNLFPVFEARRQQDEPRVKWFWADYLHYVRTGVFVRTLLEVSRGKPLIRAYAYGYVTHYITDVVGHPFVNHVTGSLWRMYWQRHHLIENYIDAYVWDRWHDAHPGEIDETTSEQPLDTIRSSPNDNRGQGAPYTFARLNDHVGIGSHASNDPIDSLIGSICARIRAGLEDVGVLESPPRPPDDEDLMEWATTLSQVFRIAYPAEAFPPQNLVGDGRTDGYPTPDDIASAYSLLRLFLRLSTEETVSEPELPDIVKDVWDKVVQLGEDVKNSLGAIPPLPAPAIDVRHLSLEAIWATVMTYMEWAVGAAVALAKAAIQFVKDAVAVAGTLLVDMIKAGLYLVKKALFDLYKHLRFVLVRQAYTTPFTEELDQELTGGLGGDTLWRTPRETIQQQFPKEELPDTERKTTASQYAPWIPPERLREMGSSPVFEEPRTWVSPYGNYEPPDCFIDSPLGQRSLLSPTGPIGFDVVVNPGMPFHPPVDFGGAVQNCLHAFRLVRQAEDSGTGVPEDMFPDYNLDGDRGYGWPCWDVRHPPGTSASPDQLGPSTDRAHVVVDPISVK